MGGSDGQRKAGRSEVYMKLVGGGVVAPGMLRQGLVVELQGSGLGIHSGYDFIGTNGGRGAHDAQSGRGGLQGLRWCRPAE